MQRSLVMTIIGEDRPGLVDSVASLVAEHGGNWLESRMSRLGGHFAGILRAEVPTEKEQSLLDALKKLDASGLKVVVHTDKSKAVVSKKPLSVLDIIGQDRPGIIREISHALAGFGVNVEELHTECISAAMSGETLFKARATLHIPESCNLQELLKTLEKIAADLFVDVSLEKDAVA
jgi:glycine cleavage system regulatory protein